MTFHPITGIFESLVEVFITLDLSEEGSAEGKRAAQQELVIGISRSDDGSISLHQRRWLTVG